MIIILMGAEVRAEKNHIMIFVFGMLNKVGLTPAEVTSERSKQ